jgi:hypothetical protein
MIFTVTAPVLMHGKARKSNDLGAHRGGIAQIK